MYSVGAAFRGLLVYNRRLKDGGTQWFAVLDGSADAPDQYRVGVVRAASFLNHLQVLGHSGPKLSQSFALFDLIGTLGALLLLLGLLERSALYRKASLTARWLAAAGFLALAFYALDWTTWYDRVGTLPAVGLTALWLWLWTPRTPAPSSRHPTGSPFASVATALALLGIVAALSTIRADLALFLAAGLFVAILMDWAGPLTLPHRTALVVTAVAAVLAAAIQLYFMRFAYPHATYGITPVFMLRHDFYRFAGWAALLIFTAPALWTLYHLHRDPARRRLVATGPAAGLLFTAPAYLLLWIVLGRLDEVRIFLPLALAILPTTMALALLRATEPGNRQPQEPGNSQPHQ